MKDSFGREITYLRVSVTDLCNLRCRYCMPAEGVCKKAHEDMLTEDELIAAVRAAVSIGITKVRLTGGEPLVKRNILSICRRVRQIEGIEEVCLTTNASRLPEEAAALKAAGISRINISLDTLDPEKYRWITRGGDFSEALAGVEAAVAAGFNKVKINAVLIGGFNDDEIRPLAELTRRYPIDVRFIEMMPMAGNTEFGEGAYISSARVLAELPELVPAPEDGGVAKLFLLPDALGCVGIISPIYAHFCAGCNRLRLTADGKIKPCLHSGEEYPLKGLSEEEMREQFKAAILGKPKWHGVLTAEQRSRSQRTMNQIGG